IAAINGPQQVVISGDEPAVLEIADAFASAGVRTRRLQVSHAFHSPLMAPMLDAFREIAVTVRYAPPTVTLVSTVDGKPADARIATCDYWVAQVTAPVRLANALRALVDADLKNFLELGPAPILSGIGAAS